MVWHKHSSLKAEKLDSESVQRTITHLLLSPEITAHCGLGLLKSFNQTINPLSFQGVERILSTKYLPVSVMQNLVKACIKRLDSQCKYTIIYFLSVISTILENVMS